jgi:transcriptional antiterminator RfaH
MGEQAMAVGSWNPDVTDWVALRMSARWEKKVAESLEAVGVPVFLPLLRKVTQYPGKRQVTEAPLFSGYVFCSGSGFIGEKTVPEGTRKMVAQILRPPDVGRFQEELATVAAFLSNHQLIQERVFGEVGDTVRIVAGPFRDREGVILELKPEKRKVILEIGFLNARLEVEMEEHLVRKMT